MTMVKQTLTTAGPPSSLTARRPAAAGWPFPGLVKAIGAVTEVFGTLGALVVLPLTAAMVYEVLSRYLFAAPTEWAFEVSYMMMGAIFYLGIAYALREDQHVSVDLIDHLAPKRLVALIDTVVYAVLALLVAWMTWALVDHAVSAYRSGEGTGLSAWNPQVWPYRVVFVIGFALFALQAFAKLLESLSRLVGVSGGARR